MLALYEILAYNIQTLTEFVVNKRLGALDNINIKSLVGYF